MKTWYRQLSKCRIIFIKICIKNFLEIINTQDEQDKVEKALALSFNKPIESHKYAFVGLQETSMPN